MLWGGAVCGFDRHSVVGGILLMSSRCERLGFHLNERHFLERLFNLRDGGVYFWIDEGIAFVKRDGVFVGTQAEIDKVLVSHKFKRAYFSSSDQVEETAEETTVRIVPTSSPPSNYIDSCGTSKNIKKNAKKRAAKKRAAKKKKKALSAHPDPPPYDETVDPPAYSPSP